MKSRAKVTSVEIEPCKNPKGSTCDIPEGKNSTIIVHFTPTEDVSDITTDIHAHIGPVWVPYPMDTKYKDACKAGFLECPSKAGKDNLYHFSLDVSTSYPKVYDFSSKLRCYMLPHTKNLLMNYRRS